MRSFLQRLAEGLRRFMYGRYGQDKLSVHLMWMALAAWLLSLFVWPVPFMTLYFVLIFFSLFRTLSRNHGARQKELWRYLKIWNGIGGFFRLQKNKWHDRKTHRYFRCKCGAVLRVPRKKGEITIHCPKCRRAFDKKT